MDANSRVIGFGGRVMGDAKPKYLNSPETKIFDKSRNLFGLNYAKKGVRKNMILCEGYMDVIALHQAGFTNAVASLGTAFTQQQANLIRRYTEEVLLTYDSDEAGVKAAMRGIPILRHAGLNGKVVHMEPYKDPDEFIKNLGQDAFRERMEEAQNSFFFEIDVLKKSYSMADPEQKTRFVHEMARKLLVFEDKVQRDSYLEALSAKYGISSEDLRRLVVRYGNQMPTGYDEVMEERRSKDRSRRRKESREGIGYSYNLLLSWLIEKPSLFAQIREWILPQDFEEGIYRTVAERLYQQLEEGKVVPAGIISLFPEVEDQTKVAAMFQTGFGSELSDEEKQKAITDLVIKIKEHSLEQQAGKVTDLNQLQELIKQKKALQNAVKLHIS
jgi:DNA primase